MTYEQQLERRVDQLETVIRVLLGGRDGGCAEWAREILNDRAWFKPETTDAA